MIVVFTPDIKNLPEGKYINDGKVYPSDVSRFIVESSDKAVVYVDDKINVQRLPLSGDIRRDLSVLGKFVITDTESIKQIIRDCDYEPIVIFLYDGYTYKQYRKETKQLTLW